MRAINERITSRIQVAKDQFLVLRRVGMLGPTGHPKIELLGVHKPTTMQMRILKRVPIFKEAKSNSSQIRNENSIKNSP